MERSDWPNSGGYLGRTVIASNKKIGANESHVQPAHDRPLKDERPQFVDGKRSSRSASVTKNATIRKRKAQTTDELFSPRYALLRGQERSLAGLARLLRHRGCIVLALPIKSVLNTQRAFAKGDEATATRQLSVLLSRVCPLQVQQTPLPHACSRDERAVRARTLGVASPTGRPKKGAVETSVAYVEA